MDSIKIQIKINCFSKRKRGLNIGLAITVFGHGTNGSLSMQDLIGIFAEIKAVKQSFRYYIINLCNLSFIIPHLFLIRGISIYISVNYVIF